MKIGIDCRLAGEKHAGIGRYIEELVRRVVKDTQTTWVLFFYEKDQIALPEQENIKIVVTPIRQYSLAEQVLLPFIFYREHLDLLHVPHYNVPLLYRGKVVITIHDLLWHTQSNASATTLSPLMHAIKYQGYTIVVGNAVKHAAKIIVPAETVKQEVLRIFPTTLAKNIVVTYEGVNEKYIVSGMSYIGGEKRDIQHTIYNILFYTGSLYPHKNVMLVVKALQKLPGYELHISSSRTVFVEQFMQQVQDLGVSDRVKHLGRLSDVELVSAYQKSVALVQPSLSEGFGLTGVEAMAAGLPVLASDIPIFREIYQDGCIFFDPKNVDSFVAAVHALEQSDRQKLTKQGQAVVSQYSWDAMAKETLAMYKSLV